MLKKKKEILYFLIDILPFAYKLNLYVLLLTYKVCLIEKFKSWRISDM